MTTQADIDAARGSIDNLDHQVKEQVKKVDGATLTTQEEAERKVLGNMVEYALKKLVLKVEGGFFRFQVGASDTVIYGLKAEYITPISTAFILGADIKTVAGLSKTTILGAKIDEIAGAKVDNLLGLKHEVTVGDTDKKGGSPMLKKEGSCSDKMQKLKMKFGSWFAKIGNYLYKADQVSEKAGSVKKDISALEEKIKKLEDSGATYQANIKKLTQDCSSKADYDATTIAFKSSGWQARGSGSFLNLFPDSQCYVEAGGSGAYCGPSDVRLAGPVHKFGCSF